MFFDVHKVGHVWCNQIVSGLNLFLEQQHVTFRQCCPLQSSFLGTSYSEFSKHVVSALFETWQVCLLSLLASWWCH